LSRDTIPQVSRLEVVRATGPFQRARTTSPPDPHLVSLDSPRSFASAQYEALRHLVEREGESRGLKIVALTSPAPGDGKTLTSVNLALVLARSPAAQVLLVDADLRRPSVLERLGIDPSGEKGLAEAVADASLSLQRVVLHSPEVNLFILPAGRPPQAPYDVLSSPSLGPLFDRVRRHFHYVVVDTPPAVGFPDYRLLEKWVDGTIIVIAAGVTPRKMIESGLEMVDPKKALGIALNRADVAPLERYYESYYGSGRSSHR
jgi:capsular exopolysaccharide synthesis family protein